VQKKIECRVRGKSAAVIPAKAGIQAQNSRIGM
jgi:hypothetical protein